MLEYIKIIKENQYKLGFVDKNSPKEWKPIINDKLSEYPESAYIDSIIIDNIVVILELNPQSSDLDDIEYIEHERKQFEEYYKHIIENIKNLEFYDL
ncbi:hypothetical protein [Methanobacterium sp.]|uniref:hypothetical protein n=1 Tax=Methanobacterium sp. TaxID=2164 RepID=UPI003C71BB99